MPLCGSMIINMILDMQNCICAITATSYGKAYGTDLWESYDADLEQYVKDVTVQELTHIACMDILAENQDMHLSEQEKKQAARAAKEYYQSLTEEEKTFIGLYEREIRTAYEEYALAEKLYHALTQGTDEEVSDDEARVSGYNRSM